MYNYYAAAFVLVWGHADTDEQAKKSRELRERIYMMVMDTPVERRVAAYPIVVSRPTDSCAIIATN